MQQEKESEGKNRKNNNRAEGQLSEPAAAMSADLAMPYTAHCCDSTADSIDKDLDGGMNRIKYDYYLFLYIYYYCFYFYITFR